MKIAYHSGILEDVQTGPHIFITQLLRHLVPMRPRDEFVSVVASSRSHAQHAASVHRIHARIRAKTIPIPQSVLHRAHTNLRFPPMRNLIGDYDIYHQMWASTDPAVPSRKLIVSMYDTVALHWPQEEGALFPQVKRLLTRAAAVMTLSEYSKSQIVQEFGVAAERVHVTYAGCEARYNNEYSNQQIEATLRAQNIATPYFFYIGGHSPRKNLLRLVKAFAQAKRDANLPHKLVMAGTLKNARDDIKAAVESAGDAIQILGYVPDEIVPHLYRGATALTFPSLFEGFGLPVVEAMACGTPVITSNVTSLPEVAGDAALMVNPTEESDIARAIVEIANEDDASRQARIARGLKQSQQFSWHKCAQAHSDVYDEVAGVRNAL